MTSTTSAVSQGFGAATARTLGLLESMLTGLQGTPYDTDLLDQTDRLHLSSTAQLAACRGWHVISDHPPVEAVSASFDTLSSDLADAHQQLVEHVTGLDTVEVLQFVDAVGTLCREMRRCVERH